MTGEIERQSWFSMTLAFFQQTHLHNTLVRPMKHTMHIVLALSLLCLVSFADIAHAQDLLQLVVMGTGSGSGAALAEAANYQDELLDKFLAAEGSSYKLVAPGGSLPADRNLRSSAKVEPRELTDLGCPNSCSNSGSTRCRILGCAYCGTCGGRRERRWLRSVTAAQQRKIEADLEADLVHYCEGKVGCTLHVRILRTKSDGTASLAT
jgi:hypothetical protein